MTTVDLTSTNAKGPHFVWIRTITGTQAQRWAVLDYGERDRLKPFVVASYPIGDDEAGLSLDELSRRYPLHKERR